MLEQKRPFKVAGVTKSQKIGANFWAFLLIAERFAIEKDVERNGKNEQQTEHDFFTGGRDSEQ